MTRIVLVRRKRITPFVPYTDIARKVIHEDVQQNICATGQVEMSSIVRSNDVNNMAWQKTINQHGIPRFELKKTKKQSLARLTKTSRPKLSNYTVQAGDRKYLQALRAAEMATWKEPVFRHRPETVTQAGEPSGVFITLAVLAAAVLLIMRWDSLGPILSQLF